MNDKLRTGGGVVSVTPPCYVDHTGFHHTRAYSVPFCRCGLNFDDDASLQGHLEAVGVRTEHDAAPFETRESLP